KQFTDLSRAYKKDKDIAKALSVINASTASEASSRKAFEAVIAVIASLKRPDNVAACIHLAVATEFALRNDSLIDVALAKRLGRILDEFLLMRDRNLGCNSGVRLHLIATRLRIGLVFGDSARSLLDYIALAVIDTAEAGRLSSEHPLFSAVEKVGASLSRSRVGQLQALIAGCAT